MKNVTYEWDIEELDEHGDIENHIHQDKLSAYRALPIGNPSECLVLVRDNWETGSRAWAYVGEDGRLPEYLEDAHGHRVAKVPQRYHRELAKAL